jgi:tetratricopeptide (TPR) repeat protein
VRGSSRLGVALWLFASSASAQEPPAKAESPPPTVMARYFAELVRLRLIDPQTGSPQTLTAEVARAEAALEAGDHLGAVAILFGIVDSPRFEDFEDTPAFQNAEYDLVLALAGAGANDTALSTVERILLRGPEGLYWDVAHRRAVDIALETRAYGDVLKRVEAVPARGAAPMPTQAVDERHYLRGRAAYEAADLATAEKELAAVGRKSRLFSSATYLRGVIRARQGQYVDATEAFCEIAQTGDSDRFTFFIDDRYYALKDLARLGMGRIAHEEGRFDDAYYHYFQIPDDSERLAEALFESAWSMYQKRELRTARVLLEELEKNFPTSPLLPEAGLLAGYVELADCRFEEARKRFDKVIAEAKPLISVVVEAQGAGAIRRELLTKALERQPRQWKRGAQIDPAPLTKTPQDRVLAMLRLDPRLVRLNDAAAGLATENATAGFTARSWRALGARLAKITTMQGGQQETVAEEEARRAADLLFEVRRLREEVRRERRMLVEGRETKQVPADLVKERLPELEAADKSLAELEEQARAMSSAADEKAAATGDQRVRGFVSEELTAALQLEHKGTELITEFEKTSEAAANAELARVRKDMERIVERAKLGKVDAVIGEKRKAEKDIEELAAGTYVPPNLSKAFQQGLIEEDEIYWPAEEEVWEDEYDRWK